MLAMAFLSLYNTNYFEAHQCAEVEISPSSVWSDGESSSLLLWIIELEFLKAVGSLKFSNSAYCRPIHTRGTMYLHRVM